MNPVTNVFRLVLLLCCVPFCQADETPAAAGPALEPPQLQPVFSDDFSSDTRSDYSIKGEVSWEPGKLTLEEGASIERAINGGAWVKVELDLDKIPLTTEQPTSELRVWFMLDGATNCCVRLRRQLENGKTVGSISLIDTGEEDGKPIEQVVRTVNVDDAAWGTLCVEYRSGLVRVTAQDDQWFAAYIENGSAAVGSVKLQSVATMVGFRNVSASAIPANEREFTEAEQEELAKASAANHQLMSLYGEGKYAAAAEIGERAVEIQKSILGRQHPDYALSLNNLAEVYKGLGNVSEAERLIREVVAIRRAQLGHDHPDYAATLNNLAGIQFSRSEYTDAANLYLEALQIKRAVLGPQHESIAINLNNLAEVYRSTGEFNRAEPLIKEGLQIRSSSLGDDHPDVAFSLNSLASLYKDMQEYANAEPLYLQAVEIRKRSVGESHPAYADSLNDLAGLYFDCFRFVVVLNFLTAVVCVVSSDTGVRVRFV